MNRDEVEKYLDGKGVNCEEREVSDGQGKKIRIVRLWRPVKQAGGGRTAALSLLTQGRKLQPAKICASVDGSARLEIDLIYGEGDSPELRELERALEFLRRRLPLEQSPDAGGDLKVLSDALRELQYEGIREVGPNALRVDLTTGALLVIVDEAISAFQLTMTGFPPIPEEQRSTAVRNLATLDSRLKWSSFALGKDGRLTLNAPLFMDHRQPDRELLQKAIEYMRKLATSLFAA